MLASAAGDQATQNDPEGVNEDREQTTYKKKNEKEAKDILLVGDTWDNDMEETKYLCDICWYHFASSDEALMNYKLIKNNIDPFRCQCSVCGAVMNCDDAL